MNTFKQIAIALTLGLVMQTQALAASQTVALNGNEGWQTFTVDDFSSASSGVEWINVTTGAALNYTFTIAEGSTGTLSVVDLDATGDIYSVFNNGILLGQTSNTSATEFFSVDPDANLANASFSSAVFTLGAGTYSISGNLFSTTQDFNSTDGALKLEISAPVPEESTVAMLLAGLGLLGFARRRSSFI